VVSGQMLSALKFSIFVLALLKSIPKTKNVFFLGRESNKGFVHTKQTYIAV
jgi:hypothetical protein